MSPSLVEQFRAHPVATTVELGSFVGCLLLFVGTFAALLSGPPTGTGGGGIWLAIVVGGAFFVIFWTLLVPLYERTL